MTGLRCSAHSDKEAVEAERRAGGGYVLMCRACSGMEALAHGYHSRKAKDELAVPEEREDSEAWMRANQRDPVGLDDPDLVEWARVAEVMQD